MVQDTKTAQIAKDEFCVWLSRRFFGLDDATRDQAKRCKFWLDQFSMNDDVPPFLIKAATEDFAKLGKMLSSPEG